MKCICGYEHEPETKLCKNGAVIYANRPFVNIEIVQQASGYCAVIAEQNLVNLYACPVCGTLKINQ